jgi:hypothetical protein
MTKENEEPVENRLYEKVSFENYEEYVAMIDRILLKIVGKIRERTPEEEEKLRKSFEELQEKVTKSKKNEG